ncbi:MAG TPA: hypothetical protein VNA89_15365 [Gemmatimonadaceae bacterium]|nr:hypothetical protein [Gemmatimonadaceae bacterium]
MKASHSARHAVVASPAPALTGLQAESWRLLWEELRADAAALAECRAWGERRSRALPEITALLRRFLRREIEVEALRAEFDRQTKTAWDLFGLRGLSGGMFLNQLVKHAPDVTALGGWLRDALAVPPSADAARARLQEFVLRLQELRRSGAADARQLQPARAAFFVTIWWHMQEPEEWPGYHVSARRAFQLEEGLFVPSGEPVTDYFAFRDVFRALARALEVDAWTLEYLCWWQERRVRAVAPRPAAPRRRLVTAVRERPRLRAPRVAPRLPARTAPPDEPARAGVGHTHTQWLLATIGRRLGSRVWVAANDHRRLWRGEPLAGLSVERLPPLGIDPDSQRLIELIDVVWLRGPNQVAAAFEIELTTSVYSGLLRMADLAALAPNLNFPLYIVTTERRLAKVRRELGRPTFRALDLHRRCGFFSAEALAQAAEGLIRWGGGPGVIDRLAERIDG